MTAAPKEPPPEEPPLPAVLLTPAEAARLLRVSKMTVYRMYHDGGLEGVRIGARNLRISRASIKAIMGDVWPGE